MMVEVGFSAEHRRGSEWTFWTDRFSADAGMMGDLEWGDDDDNRSITIHQPHPDPKMSAAKLKQTGRRFARRFGWERECFRMGEETDE